MPLPRKRLVIPLASIALVVLALFLLSHFEVIDLPGGLARAEDGSAADSTGTADGKAGAAKGDKKKDKKGKDDEPEDIPVPVELARAEKRPLAAYYRASSVLEADRHVELVAKTEGRIHRVLVEEGDWVKAGQTLAEMENDRERVQVRQAELKAEEEERELERRRALVEKHLVTQEEFEASRGAYELASAERDLARITLQDTMVKAPFDGQVTERKIVAGQHVNPSAPLFTLVDFEPLRVRIHLPEAIARRVTAGDQVLVSVDALEQPLAAVVERVAPVVDPETSTVRLTLLMKAGRGEALVGGFVKVRITTDTKTEALAVPKLALVEEGGLRSVFVADGDSTRKVEIRTGLADEEAIEVLDGLTDGAFVVTMGQGGLRSGSKIDVLNAKDVGWTPPPVDSTKTQLAEADGKGKKKDKKGS